MAYVMDCLPAIVLSSQLREAHWRSLHMHFSTNSSLLVLEKHQYHVHSHKRLYSLAKQASAR